ncbi:MAG TPA: hypothetical protein VK348_13215, partial [Planctomycetota bacterium]|nr:hypothetical protein [Planctomycetota bacterium]
MSNSGSRTLLALAVLLVAAIVALWLTGSWPSPDVGRSGRAAAGTGQAPVIVDGAVATAPLTASADALTSARTTAPAGELQLLAAEAATGYRGRVVTGDGSPVAGMIARLFRAAPDAVLEFGLEPMSLQPAAPQFEVARSATAADGRFELLGIAPRGLCCLRLDFPTPASVAEPLRSGHGTCIAVQRSPAPGEVVDLGDLRLKRGAVITGRVVDASGAAVAGARVRAGVLPPLPFAWAPLERFGPETRIVVQMPNGLQDVVVLPAWCADLLAALPLANAVTRGDGGFELFAVDPGEVTLLVDAPLVGSLVRQRLPVRAGSTQDVGELALPAGAQAEVKVVDTAGKPVAGAEVVVAPASVGAPAHLGEPAGSTDADGHARHSGLPRAAIVVAARRSPLDNWLVVGPSSADREVVVTLPATCALTIAVLDPSGKPIEAPQVQLLGGPVDSGVVELAMFGVERAIPLSGRTQRLDDGRMRVTDLLPGSYCVLAAAKGWATASLDVQLQRDAECTLQLRACRPLRVRVVDAAAAPVAGATLYMQPRGGERSQRIVDVPLSAGRTGADGTAIIPDLPTATTRVTASHPLFGQVHAEVQGQLPELLLQFEDSGVIVGRLTDGGRPPAPGRWLAVLARRPNDAARGAL